MPPGQTRDLSCKDGYKGGMVARCPEDGRGIILEQDDSRGLEGCFESEWRMKCMLQSEELKLKFDG